MKFLPEITVKIQKNLAKSTLDEIAKIGLGTKKMLLVSDEKIFKNCARFFDEEFKSSVKTLILKDASPDQKNISKIKNAVKNHDLIVALGSGVISDLCKFVSSETKIPYIIFASAPSMNGYLSKNASLVINGHKKTVAATLPKAVFCDLDILKSAPKKMIQAGIGDSLCFYSCWFDWKLSHLILHTKFDEKPFEMLKNKMDFFVKNYKNFELKDEKLLEKLIEILLLSGSGMTIAGGSYPASQSEHLIAHFLSMRHKKIDENYFHGLQIAISTSTSARLQKQILKKTSLQVKCEKFDDKKIAKILGKKIAAECKKEYATKAARDLGKINKSLEKNWQSYKNILAEIYFDEKILDKIFKHFEISSSYKYLKISKNQYDEAVKNAKFIRNRFTVLDFQ